MQRLFAFALLSALLSAALIAPQTPSRAGTAFPLPFDVTISLEWKPGAQAARGSTLPDDLAAAGCAPDARTTYLDDLEAGFTEASNYLYSYSQGRFALRHVTIDTDGSLWDKADIRILADGSYRPTAEVGGVVGQPTRYISTTTPLQVVFYPGTVTLGRGWNGLGARCGAWSQPEGWRTIGHEWAHYALYLWDEYYEQFTLNEQYCTTTGFPFVNLAHGERAPAKTTGRANSVMAYQYTTDQLWTSGAPGNCSETPQMRVNGVSDWETIQRFYGSLGAPGPAPADPAPAPTFTRVGAAPTTDSTTALVKVDGFPAASDVARSYSVRGADGQISRIIGQGDIAPGEQTALLGVDTTVKDRAHVGIEHWASGAATERAVYPAQVNAADPLDTTPGAAPQNLVAQQSLWRPAIRIVPFVQELRTGESKLTGLNITVQDCASRTKRIRMFFCPAGGNCTDLGFFSLANGVFTAQVFQPALPDEFATKQASARGYIYVQGMDTNEEVISTYQIQGGAGSGHIGAHPPLMDGAAVVETPKGNDPPANQDVRVLTSTALVCTAPVLPPGVRSLIGSPIQVEPVLANANGGRAWGQEASDPPLAVRLSYSQDLLDRLGIDERSLVVLRSDSKQRIWQIMPVSSRSLALDWVAATATPYNGTGAVYALGRVDSIIALPLVVR